MIYFCCDELRRREVEKHGTLNGIDFLEVVDDPKLPAKQRQRKLSVHFLNENHLATLTKENARIEGGERVRDVGVTRLEKGTGDWARVLTIQVDKAGDFSIYTLRLVKE